MSQKLRDGGGRLRQAAQQRVQRRTDKPAFGNQIRFAVDTVRELMDYVKARNGKNTGANQDADTDAGSSSSPTTSAH